MSCSQTSLSLWKEFFSKKNPTPYENLFNRMSDQKVRVTDHRDYVQCLKFLFQLKHARLGCKNDKNGNATKYISVYYFKKYKHILSKKNKNNI